MTGRSTELTDFGQGDSASDARGACGHAEPPSIASSTVSIVKGRAPCTGRCPCPWIQVCTQSKLRPGSCNPEYYGIEGDLRHVREANIRFRPWLIRALLPADYVHVSTSPCHTSCISRNTTTDFPYRQCLRRNTIPKQACTGRIISFQARGITAQWSRALTPVPQVSPPAFESVH